MYVFLTPGYEQIRAVQSWISILSLCYILLWLSWQTLLRPTKSCCRSFRLCCRRGRLVTANLVTSVLNVVFTSNLKLCRATLSNSEQKMVSKFTWIIKTFGVLIIAPLILKFSFTAVTS
jgi:hypothetical protein